MTKNNSKTRDFHSLNRETTPITDVRSTTLCEDFHRRKWTWIIGCGVFTVLIVVGISIPTIQILKRVENAREALTTGIHVSRTTATVTTTTTTTTTSTTPKVNTDTKWNRHGKTVAGGNGAGHKLNQLMRPMDICVDDDVRMIFIADAMNHRIVGYSDGATIGRVVAGGNGEGNEMHQLNYPTHVTMNKSDNSLIICELGNKRVVQWSLLYGTTQGTIILHIQCCGLAMDNKGDLYFIDYDKHEVRRWTKRSEDETIVAGGHGAGDQLNQLDSPFGIFVDEDHTVYVADTRNHRVMKWVKGAKEGVIVAGGNGKGYDLSQLNSPSGVIVDYYGNVYVCEYDNSRITRWSLGSKVGILVVGIHGSGNAPYQLNNPDGLSFDGNGNLYVVDMGNDRVQKFDIIEN